ncbi:MAG: hydroxypyruvate isomerase [Verrucomicrobiota bacterium]
MPKFAANLTMLFTEVPFMERFAEAKKAGFSHVEYLLPYAFSVEELKEQLEKHQLKQILFNFPCGDWAASERGIACLPSRVEEFRAGVALSLRYAQELKVFQLNILAGKKAAGITDEEHWKTLVENVRFAAKSVQSHGITVLVEAINHFDIPGFFLNRVEQVAKLLEEVNEPNVRIQFDVYHVQREEGEITATLRKYFSKIGHIQIADNPGRNQPGTGEIHYPFILREIDQLGFTGQIGLEYVPKGESQASFGWIRDFGYQL